MWKLYAWQLFLNLYEKYRIAYIQLHTKFNSHIIICFSSIINIINIHFYNESIVNTKSINIKFRVQPSNNNNDKPSSDIPGGKVRENKNGGDIVVNSRNPLTCSRSCGVHWLTPEALLWSRRGVLEEIRNTPRIYVRASFAWWWWCTCVREETFRDNEADSRGF